MCDAFKPSMRDALGCGVHETPGRVCVKRHKAKMREARAVTFYA